LIDVGGVRHGDILIRRGGGVDSTMSCRFSFRRQLILLLLIIACRRVLSLALLITLLVELRSLSLLTDPACEASGDKSACYISR